MPQQLNWKQCVCNRNDDKDVGLIQVGIVSEVCRVLN